MSRLLLEDKLDLLLVTESIILNYASKKAVLQKSGEHEIQYQRRISA